MRARWSLLLVLTSCLLGLVSSTEAPKPGPRKGPGDSPEPPVNVVHVDVRFIVIGRLLKAFF